MLFLPLFFLSLVYGGGGVTKSSGISDFWTDDYKVFDQVYGKTSDKDLYGATLPVGRAGPEKSHRTAASEKKERFIEHQDLIDLDSYKYGDRYTKLFHALNLQDDEDTTTKVPQAISHFNFISYNKHKPITKYNDPQSYNYLKHLEEHQNKQKTQFPKSIGGFIPYSSYESKESEETQAYKSIQDILDAHEANKGRSSSEEDDNVEYITYGPGNTKKPNTRKKPGGEYNKPKCQSGRCRKRATNVVRVRSRPYIRRIIQNRWY